MFFIVFAPLFDSLRAVAAQSPHPTEKIAAQICYSGGRRDVACFNARPAIIDDLGIPQGQKIADRSLYAHAETRAILMASRATKGTTLYATDPFCPNCAKQILCAGIKRVVIDGSGFAKPYFQKNKAAFESVSLSIAQWFGIEVCVWHDGKTQKLSPDHMAIDDVVALEEACVLPVRGGLWTRQIAERALAMRGDAFTTKYDGRIEAFHIALIGAARKGLKPDTTREVFLSHWPSNPRVFIDGLTAGLTRYDIMHKDGRPDWADELAALGITIL